MLRPIFNSWCTVCAEKSSTQLKIYLHKISTRKCRSLFLQSSFQISVFLVRVATNFLTRMKLAFCGIWEEMLLDEVGLQIIDVY